jgi:hypothetical protein
MSRDQLEDFAQVFADIINAQARWTPEQIDAYADEYQRDQIATAQSDQAQEQLRKEYNRE